MIVSTYDIYLHDVKLRPIHLPLLKIGFRMYFLIHHIHTYTHIFSLSLSLSLSLSEYIYIYVFKCVWVCVCMCGALEDSPKKPKFKNGK